jgi:polar amino acid transport system substrate-binding protein
MKRFFNVVILITILALLLTACAPAKPADKLDSIKKAGKIVVGTSPDYPPFESKDANGNFQGFDIDLMNEVAKRIGVTVEWTDMPFDSLVAAVQTSKLDASASAFNFDEKRAEKVDFTDAYYVAKDAFMVANGFKDTFSKPEDLAKYKVGAQSGTTQDSWITDNLVKKNLLPEGNYFRYDRVDQAAMDVKSGRVDVLMGDNIPLVSLAKSIGGLKVAYETDVSSGPVMFILPKGETTLKEAINKAIADLKKEGFVDQLAIKWFK